MKPFLLLLMIVSFSCNAFARQDGDGTREPALSGSVYETSSKKPVKGVIISVIAAGDPVAKQLLTDAAGNFVIPALPAGEFTIVLEKKGYRTIRKEKLVIREGMQVRLRLDLSNDSPLEENHLFQPLYRMMKS